MVPVLLPTPVVPVCPVCSPEFVAPLSNGTGGNEVLSLSGESSWDVTGGRETTKIFLPAGGLAKDAFWDADVKK